MTKVKNSVVQLCCYSYSDYCLKATDLNAISRKHLSDVDGEMYLVLIVFVFL